MNLTGFDKLLSESLGVSQRKQKELAETSQRMENKFNPLNWENVEHVDGDTFRLKDTGRTFRVQNDPSKGVDTYESDRRIYENDPIRLANHKRNYAKLTGRPEWSITINELVERGQVQSEQTRSRMAELGQQGRLAFQSNGIDDYGRELIQLYDTETGENFYGGHSGREQNASYDSKFNAGQQLDDIFSGEQGRYTAFQGNRGAKQTAKDLGVSLAVGTGRMLTGLAQGALVLLDGNGPVTDRFFNAVNEGLDNFHNEALSNEALARNARVDRNRARNVEAYGIIKNKYLEAGYSELESKIFAGAEEFQNTVGDLLTEPGYILDKTVESLPYMIGVASAGRVAVTQATKLLAKNTTKKLVKQGATKEGARKAARDYVASKEGQAILSEVAAATGISTVGITEALTNSTDVYNSVLNMSPEEANKSEQYRALRAEGLGHQEATRALAEAAFESVFLPGLVMAVAASAITGIGGWEARLFTNKAGKSAITKATDDLLSTAKTGSKGVTGKVKDAANRTARFLGPAAGGEALEEGIQSGGGEFLSQLAEFEAGLGEEPGPGIGAAASEGAVVGFASGVGAQTVTGGVKKLANSNPLSSGFEKARDRKAFKVFKEISEKGTEVPGGSAAKIADKAKQQKKPADPKIVLGQLERFDLTKLDNAKSAVVNWRRFKEVVDRVGVDNLNDKQREQWDAINGAYLATVDEWAGKILKQGKNPEDLTTGERQALQKAFALEVPSVRDVDPKSIFGEALAHTGRINRSIENLQKQATETSDAEEVDPGGSSQAVRIEKMGNGIASNGRPGLGMHAELISEAIAANDPEAVKSRSEDFAGFMQSQRGKLRNVAAAIKDKADRHNIKYTEGATERFYNTLQKEYAEMTKVRDELAGLYRTWATNGATEVVAKVPEAPAPVEVPKGGTNQANEGTAETAKETPTENKEEGTEQPARKSRKVGDLQQEGKTDKFEKGSRKIVKEGKDEGDSKQESAEQPNEQPGTGSESGTAAKTEQETSTESKPKPERAAGTASDTQTQSEERKSDNAESTASDVEQEKPLKQLRGKAREEITFVTPDGTERTVVAAADFTYFGERFVIHKAIGEKGWTVSHRGTMYRLGPPHPTIRKAYDRVIAVLSKKDETVFKKDLARAFEEISNRDATESQEDEARANHEAAQESAQEQKDKATEPTKRAAPETSGEPINVWSGSNENPEFSNLTLRPFTYKGNKFYSVEHAYQTWKSGQFDQNIYQQAGWKRNGTKIIGRRKPKTDNHWNIKLMAVLVRDSFNQNPAAKKVLLATGDRPFTHNSPRGKTDIWTNTFPVILNRVRDNLRGTKSTEQVKPVYANEPESETLSREDIEAYFRDGLDELSYEELVALEEAVLEAFSESTGDDIKVSTQGIYYSDQIQAEYQRREDVANSLEATIEEDGAETEGGAQAEAQPERSAQPEVEGDTQPTAEEVRRNDNYWDMLTEIRRLQSRVESGEVSPEQARFIDEAMNKRFLELLEEVTGERAVEKADVLGVIAQMETGTLNSLNQDIPRSPTNTENLNLDEVLTAAKELRAKGQTKAAPKTVLLADSFLKPEGWPRLRRWLGSKFPNLEIMVQRVEEAFAKFGLARSVEHGYERASQTAKSLIAAVPNLHLILANRTARGELYDALNLTTEEIAAFEAFRHFRDEYEVAINEATEDLWNNKVNFPDGNRLKQNPAYIFNMMNDRMDPTVVTAMAYEAMNWLTGDAQRSMYNDDDAIRNILGLDEGVRITREQRVLHTAGTLRNSVVRQLGRAAFRQLNLKVKTGPELSSLLQERTEAALGTIMVRALQITQPPGSNEAGRIEAVGINRQWFREEQGPDAEPIPDSEQAVSFVRIKPKSDHPSQRWEHLEDNENLTKALRPARATFQRLFGVSSVVKEPMLEKPTKDHIAKRAMRSVTKLSQKMLDAFEWQQEREWTTDNDMIEILSRFNEEEYLAAAHEFERDLSGTHKLDLKSVEGRNNTMLQALRNAKEWHNMHGDRTFYFTYFMTRTGRANIASTFINPQSSKLHRFIFRQKAWTQTIQPGDTRLLNNLKIAIALGMDIKVNGKGVDKLTQDETLAAVEALFDPTNDSTESKQVREALAQLATEGSNEIPLYKKDGSPTALAEVLGREGTHTLAALRAWQAYENSNGKAFTVSMPMEVDGVTNGFSAGMLQTPPIDTEDRLRIMDLLRATGVLFTDNTETGFPQWLQDPNHRDNYQKAAQLTADYIERIRYLSDEAIEEEPHMGVLKENLDVVLNSGLGMSLADLRDPIKGRKFAKNPLMIIAYGASSATVARNIVAAINDDIYTKLAKANKIERKKGESDRDYDSRRADYVLGILNSAVDVMNVGQKMSEALYDRNLGDPQPYFTKREIWEMIKSGEILNADGNPVKDIGEFAQSYAFDGKYDAKNFAMAMSGVYGRSMQKATGDMLKGISRIRDVYNRSITYMNAIFLNEFKRRVGIEERQTGRPVGQNRRREIVRQMHKEGHVPSIKTPHAQTYEENLELARYDSEVLGSEQIKIVYEAKDIDRRYITRDGKEEYLDDGTSLTSALEVMIPSIDVGVAGVVGTIHSLDGNNAMEIFGQYDILNMFDAGVMSIADMDIVPNAMNEVYFNQHQNYDMGQELLKSFERMIALRQDSENRMTAQDRKAAGIAMIQSMMVHGGYDADVEAIVFGGEVSLIEAIQPLRQAFAPKNEIMAFVKKFLEENSKPYHYDNLNEFITRELRSTVEQVTRARKELFKQIQRVHQFSHDQGAYEVSQEEREAAMPQPNQTPDYLIEQEKRQRIDNVANTLAVNADRGTLTEAMREWLNGGLVYQQEALRVLGTFFAKIQSPAAPVVLDLVRVMHETLPDSAPVRVETLPMGTYAIYLEGRVAIDLDQIANDDDVSAVSVLLHELIHAGTFERLVQLTNENPTALLELKKQAQDAIRRMKSKKYDPDSVEGRVLEVLENEKDEVRLVAEYVAYALSLPESTVDLSLIFQRFGDGYKRLNQALNAVGRILTQDNKNVPVLRSSNDKVDSRLFENVEETKLESEKLWLNYEKMQELDQQTGQNPTGAFRAHITRLMEDILIPGIASLRESTYLQLGVKQDSNKNIGEVARDSDRNVLRVQAAGAKLTNNGDMSNQEVYTHELTHAVLGFALDTDTKVRAEMRKIFDSVKDKITWQDFMPAEEDIAGDRAAVEAAAKERYDYIFGENKHDTLQEFAAIALTNEQFALALTKLDAPTAQEPIWDGNLLSSILNLLMRGLELLRGQQLGTRSAANAHDATFKLAQRIVTINKQAKAREKDKKGHYELWRNGLDNWANEKISKLGDRIQQATYQDDEEKRQKGGFKNLIRAGTHAALASRSEHQQEIWNQFGRHLGVNKSNDLSQIISEILPYNRTDRNGVDGKTGFIDLLRHSKVAIDIARQRAIEHSRGVLMAAFDKARPMTRGHRIAMTNVLIKTDLVSLMEHNKTKTLTDLHRLLRNPAAVDTELARLQQDLTNMLSEQNAQHLNTMFERQMENLARYMIEGVMQEYHGMKNAHNIVNQYNLIHANDRTALQNKDQIIALVDQIVTLKALKRTPQSDIDLALHVINHEMSRDDDNGFMYTLGMHSNFKKVANKKLFGDNPVLQKKGYVYEITDGDRNIEVIMDTPEERQRMEDLGMVRIGEVPRDPADRTTSMGRAMYKGYRGANTWQKSVVSLTSLHSDGTDLFAVSGFKPKETAAALNHMKKFGHKQALGQTKAGVLPNAKSIAIPILDEKGNIKNYAYEMSAETKKQHLQNARYDNYFDQVLPRMFGSIPDRVESRVINGQVASLLYKEWDKFRHNTADHRFVDIGKNSKNPRQREMFQLIPQEMKDELAVLFRGTDYVQNGQLVAFPIRDEAVNLVMGFRKLSILDLPGGKGKKLIRGQKATFAARTVEQIWKEIMQLVRIKMAIINPTVVIGNLSSNFGILLAEGIPVRYIQEKTSEAIRSMRQYQRDIKKVDELQRKIAIYQNAGKPTRSMQAERSRLLNELDKNPVGKLVREGLFTSIVEEVSSEEDTYREWLLGSVLDKAKGPLPGKAVAAVKEVHMVPGSTSFNMAIAATQYGDFIGRYVKFKYDTEQKGINEHDAIHRALASFIYYDMPQNRYLQFMNDNGFMMFSKFFLRIQPVVAKLFQENPTKAVGVLAAQQALMGPFDENIGTFALFAGGTNRLEANPLNHLEKLDPTDPSLFQWLWPLGL